MQLTDSIYQTLFLDILNGVFRPGEGFLTEQAAMDRFKVSRITIRRVYSRLEEEHIILRKQKVGTVINDKFSSGGGQLNMLGILAPMHNTFARIFINTICKIAATKDILTVLDPAECGTEQNESVVRLVRHGLRDIIIWGLDRSLDMELFFRLRLLGVNLVFFDRIRPGEIADYVVLDNYAAMETLVARAHEQGIKQVFYVDPEKLDVDTSRERKDACWKTCAKHQIPCSEQLPPILPADSAIIAVNASAALGYADLDVPVFCIDSFPNIEKKNIIGYPQPMREMAEMCFKALQKQRQYGEKWRPREFRIAGDGLA